MWDSIHGSRVYILADRTKGRRRPVVAAFWRRSAGDKSVNLEWAVDILANVSGVVTRH